MSTKAKIKDRIYNRILEKAKILGNTEYGFRELASDLVGNYIKQTGKGGMQKLADGTFLSPHTLERIRTLEASESGAEYNPNSDTCNRIFRFFGASFIASEVEIKASYRNKPKVPS